MKAVAQKDWVFSELDIHLHAQNVFFLGHIFEELQ